MDTWKYYGVTHRDHIVCNPTSDAKLNELVEVLRLDDGVRVLDVACGKAELLCRIADRYAATGVGVDISPYEVRAAREKVAERGFGDRIEIVEGDGADYPALKHSFDVTMCIGATWVWGGFAGSLRAMLEITKPGGLVMVGEPFKMREPSPEYATAEPDFVPTLVTHAENVEIALAEGLTLLYAMVSNQDDWDRYEALQWRAAETYAVEHPDDPDVPELLERQRRGRDTYLKWGRDTLNWAIYVMRAPL